MVSNMFPTDWKVEKLIELGFSYSGLKSKSKKDFDENGNASFVTYRNINRNYFVDKQDLASVHVKSTENQNAVEKGDVLFTGSSETPDEVAISSVMACEIDNLYLNSFCFGYRFNDVNKTLPDFYAYYFRADHFRKTVFPLAQGSTRYNISKNELLKVEVPVPCKKEQQKIAAILSSVDEAIEKTEQIIEQTETVKKGLMQQLLTKGIGHTKFKKTKIGILPSSWDVIRFDDCFHEFFDYRGRTPKKLGMNWGNGNIPALSANNVKMGHIDFEEECYTGSEELYQRWMSKSELEQGDILFTMEAPLGNVAQVPDNKKYILSQRVVAIRPKEFILKDYLRYYLMSPSFQSLINRFSTGTTAKGISQKNLFPLLVAIPSMEEQIKIVNTLWNMDDKLLNENNKLNKLVSIKQGLMQQLLTGKTRVKINEKEEVPS
ncbi:restriction endonuclease subunit S [Gracilibacillus sp. S3-1-1]|uniref:Restriction endonuclease subunit S n=1 Tax=Gracilibacillus pellucidus TaxID=3095368 RepID=A0ACC6M8S0_9BACI|nr:restriction endonuclease subunit S [Gracilibacillus sp. S3-1-1]MDX8047288.1 restriction endonuclease subunit S [Gracilibacillus sp. S3-1-1]